MSRTQCANSPAAPATVSKCGCITVVLSGRPATGSVRGVLRRMRRVREGDAPDVCFSDATCKPGDLPVDGWFRPQGRVQDAMVRLRGCGWRHEAYSFTSFSRPPAAGHTTGFDRGQSRFSENERNRPKGSGGVRRLYREPECRGLLLVQGTSQGVATASGFTGHDGRMVVVTFFVSTNPFRKTTVSMLVDSQHHVGLVPPDWQEQNLPRC